MEKKTKSDQDELVKKEINEQFLLSKRYLDPIHSRMNSQEELYRSFIDSAQYPHGAKVFDPRVFRVIETVTPRMVSNEPTGSFYPTEEGDVAIAEILNALIKYDWRRAEMFPKLVMFVKSMLIFGTAFGRVFWNYKECEKTQMVPKEVGGKMVWTPTSTEKSKYVEFDGPDFEPLNIYDCFPDPNATSMNNMRWFIYRTFKTMKELESENETRGTEYYKNLDKIKEALDLKKNRGNSGGVATSSADGQFREHRRLMLSTQEFKQQDESNPEVVILRRFSRDRWVDYCPEFGVVIRDVENPYFHGKLPIICGVDYPYPGDLYGMGEIEPIDRIQRAINAVLNQRLDNVQLTLRTMWKVKKNSGVDMHTLVSAPGNVVTTDDMTAVEPIQVPDVTGPTFVQTMNYLTASMQNGSGITDYTMGINSKANTQNDTATGTRLIQQEANAQFKLKIQLFNHMVIQNIANQWKDLRIQYTTEAQRLRIIGREEVKYLQQETGIGKLTANGEEAVPGDFSVPRKLQVSRDGQFAFLTLMPEDIQPSVVGDYDFIAAPSSEQLTDPIALQENFFAAIDRVSNPQWVQGLNRSGKDLNYAELTEKVFEKLNIGIEDKNVIIDIQEVQNMNQPMNDARLNADPTNVPGMEDMLFDVPDLNG